jgi:CheY-like chemotaxis protein
MPALNGDAVCKMLKENPRTKAVRIALYSSMDERELEAMTKSVGADGYIVKTDDADKLASEVRRLLAG